MPADDLLLRILRQRLIRRLKDRRVSLREYNLIKHLAIESRNAFLLELYPKVKPPGYRDADVLPRSR